MKTYKVSPILGAVGMVRLDEQYESGNDKFWRYIGLFDPNRAARFILLDITKDPNITIENADRFESHFFGLRTRLPRIITMRDVLNWLGEQAAASI
jgi:hypothetical protein